MDSSFSLWLAQQVREYMAASNTVQRSRNAEDSTIKEQ